MAVLESRLASAEGPQSTACLDPETVSVTEAGFERACISSEDGEGAAAAHDLNTVNTFKGLRMADSNDRGYSPDAGSMIPET